MSLLEQRSQVLLLALASCTYAYIYIYPFRSQNLAANYPIWYADKQDVRQRLNLRWGVIPFRMDFARDPEQNIQRTFQLLKRREMVSAQDLVIVVSDLKPLDGSIVRSIQVRRVPNGN